MSTAAPAEPRHQVHVLGTPDGAELAVSTHGDPDAPLGVLLCHGWTMSALDWRPHIDALTRPRPGFPALRAISFDQRGHGRSTRGSAVLDMELLCADLALVLSDAARDGRPVILIGHSMGGMAIQELAARRPGLFGTEVAGVGLISTSLNEVGATLSALNDRPGPTGTPGSRRRARTQQKVADRLLRSPRAARTAHRLLTGPLSHPTTAPLWRAVFGPGPTTEAVRANARAFRDVPVLAIAEFYSALTSHDCAGRIRALGNVPTRVLVGELDRYTPPDQARALASEIPGATLQTVPGHGHDLPYEQPVLVVETVHALLREGAHGLPGASGISTAAPR
ncbi:alpha/beta fold hydrolase [Streptomyces sp. NPDC054855]